MTILTVDQSYTSSGIVALSDDGKVQSAELYKSDAEQDIFTRAWEIANHIATIANSYNARFVAIEGLAYAKAGDATRDLAGLQFVVASVLRFLHHYHVELVYPTTAKKFATGKGNSNKEQLLESLPEQAHTAFKQTGAKKTTGLLDLADAYWIGQVALNVVPSDYVSKPVDDETLDEHTERAVCERLREQTGYEARVNPETLAAEVFANGRWVQIQIAE